MENSEWAAKIKEHLDKADTLIIGAECEVKYFGKVESFLSLGDRLIVIKNDRTLLVHQPNGVNPINYMKEGTEHIIFLENDHLVMKSRHLFYKDFIEIKMTRIHMVDGFHLEDNHKIQVMGSEADMSDMIYDNPALIEEGFKPFSREEHTKYGFIDVFGTDKDGRIMIIECKRDMADFKAVSQLHRYIHKIVKSRGVAEKDVRGIIASPRISENAMHMLKDYGYEYRSITPPKYLERYDKKQKRLGEF